MTPGLLDWLEADVFALFNPAKDGWWSGRIWVRELCRAKTYVSHEHAERTIENNPGLAGCTVAMVTCRVHPDSFRRIQSAKRLADRPPARGLF